MSLKDRISKTIGHSVFSKEPFKPSLGDCTVCGLSDSLIYIRAAGVCCAYENSLKKDLAGFFLCGECGAIPYSHGDWPNKNGFVYIAVLYTDSPVEPFKVGAKKSTPCECGAAKCGHSPGSMHSSWCPAYSALKPPEEDLISKVKSTPHKPKNPYYNHNYYKLTP